jgi:Mg2+ and Co2+ transporter CorA
MELTSVAVTALVQAAIGFLFWILMQRTVEKVDRLQREIEELKDRRVAAIESTAKEESEKNAARRKEIYERLAKVERESVTVAKCHEQHQELLEGFAEYRGAVIDLGKVQEKLSLTANFVSEVNERVIALKEDVARMQGEHHGRG